MKQTAKQQGFVSIIVAMIVMLIVSLLALGFAFLVRQNQIQSQNRVFSTQAFYAAESGVNDANDYISNYVQTKGTVPPDITSCNDNTLSVNGYNKEPILGNNQVDYTCVLTNSTPNDLQIHPNTEVSNVMRVQSQDGQPINSITISWQDDSGNTTFANNPSHQLPDNSYNTNGATTGNANNLYKTTGILRVTIIPILNPITRDDLTYGAQTLFLYPNGSGDKSKTGNFQGFLTTRGINSVSDGNQGKFVDGHCNTDPSGGRLAYCAVTINNLPGSGSNPGYGAGTNLYYVRVKSIYRSSNVFISATDSGASPSKLVNAQTVIDSTGRDQNVLRRIQVRVPTEPVVGRPEFAIETAGSICKRLSVFNGGVNFIDIPGVPKPPAICIP